MKIKGLKSAVGDYQHANAGGFFSPSYGCLMFDKSTGELWTDYFCSIGHNEWKVYHSDAIIDLGQLMTENGLKINMRNVKEYIEKNF